MQTVNALCKILVCEMLTSKHTYMQANRQPNVRVKTGMRAKHACVLIIVTSVYAGTCLRNSYTSGVSNISQYLIKKRKRVCSVDSKLGFVSFFFIDILYFVLISLFLLYFLHSNFSILYSYVAIFYSTFCFFF